MDWLYRWRKVRIIWRALKANKLDENMLANLAQRNRKSSSNGCIMNAGKKSHASPNSAWISSLIFTKENWWKKPQDRFVRLRSMADNLRPDHKNADFLMRLLDEFEGNPHTSAEQNPKQHSVSVEAKEHSTHCEEAPSCRQLLSPADVNESFFVCGQDSLVVLLQETARGCPCGSPFFFDGDNSVKNMDGHGIFLQEWPQNKMGKFVNSW